MNLTEIDILDAFYGYVSSSALDEMVSGALYRMPRPINSKLEDVVISVLATGRGQIQPFVVNINVYVPDIKRGQEHLLNEERMTPIMREGMKLFEHGTFVHSIDGKEYGIIFELESQKIYEVSGVNFHAINHKINVRVSTE